jgi:AI-2 transport protein TqsA
MTPNKISTILITFIATVVIFIYGQNVLIPLIFAFLLWFLVRKIRTVIDKVKVIKNRIPSWIKNLTISLFLFSILSIISNALSSNIISIANSYKKYEANIESITAEINRIFNINLIDLAKGYSTSLDLESIFGAIFNSLTFILGNAFIIIIYTLFIFLEEVNFKDKLRAMFKTENHYIKTTSTLDKIEKSITDYIGLKTLISLITGVLSYVVLVIIGIDSPFFWASLIFICNFIPTIGSLIGTAFPAIFSLIQFGEFTPFIMILLFIGTIQIIIGNILEPKLMGNSLNISALVTIISLSFWGYIWGITGMILSTPITVIMVIIFAQFEKTKAVAILLSDKGKI